jgi:2-oxoglutarate ferredoxin oxidoreductase subunit beta
MKDPGRVLMLTHPRGFRPSDGLARTYRNQQVHDPSDLAAARTIASVTDPIPVGLLYWDPEVPRYERTRGAGQLRTTDHIRAGLEAELDKFTIWPDDAEP